MQTAARFVEDIFILNIYLLNGFVFPETLSFQSGMVESVVFRNFPKIRLHKGLLHMQEILKPIFIPDYLLASETAGFGG